MLDTHQSNLLNILVPIIYKAFFILQKPEHNQSFDFWQHHIQSAIITGIHPALIEMMLHRDIFLLQSFSAKAEEYLRDTNKKKLSIRTWDNICELASIHYPLFGLISDDNKTLNTQIESMGLLHKFGIPQKRGGILSSKVLLKYDAPEDQIVSNTELFRSSRESTLITRILNEYTKVHSHALDGISIAVINANNIQPIIAGIDKFIENIIRDQEEDTFDAPPYYLTLILLTKAGTDHLISHWMEEWKQRWNAVGSENKFRYYNKCRLSISQRFASAGQEVKDYIDIVSKENFEVDVLLLPSFIESGLSGNEFLTMGAYKVDYNNPLKYPIVEMPCSKSDDPSKQNQRSRIISNRQFQLATLHSEMSAALQSQSGKSHVVRTTGDFKKWIPLIDKIHTKANWVGCIDPFIDEHLIAQYNYSGAAKREIIGFASGLGAHGELNYTVSTERTSLHNIEKGIVNQVNRLVGPWDSFDLKKASHFIVEHSRKLAGLSLVRATSPKDEYVRNLIAFALVRAALPKQKDIKNFLCDELISLDTFSHWFDDADTGGFLPDLLRIVAFINDQGFVEISAHIIECKFAKYSESHLDKAHNQLEHGLIHLTKTFLPCQTSGQNRHDQRYWWAQLQRLIAGKSNIAHHSYHIAMNALEKLLSGYFVIRWYASAVVFWTDQSGDSFKIHEKWPLNFGKHYMEINAVSCGTNLIHKICCTKDMYLPIPLSASYIEYGIESENIQEQENKLEDIELNISKDEGGDIINTEFVSGDSHAADENENESDKIHIIEDEENNYLLKIPQRIFLGNAINNDSVSNKRVYWEFGHKQLTNRHFLIFGQSGTGKTYAIQSILYELSRQEQNSIIVDYTNGFESSQLEYEIKESVNPKQHLVIQTPLPINPFRKQSTIIDGQSFPEKDTNTAMRIVSVFDSVYNLGEQQRASLYNAIMEGFKTYGNSLNLESLTDILQHNASEKGIGKEPSASLLNKIIPFVHQEPFRDETPESWNSFYTDQNHRVHIIQLAGCSKIISRLITEFILVDFYWYARSIGNKNQPKVIVLDEIQNLDHKLESPLGSFLTEGRKFGISSILATQTLSNLHADQKDRLFQSAHKLFFKPAETEVQEYSKILEKVTGESSTIWIQRLSQLKKGQCYSIGPSLNEKTDTLQDNKPYKIEITSLQDRLKGNYYDSIP
ncbi:MAG: ATP-binding protein [Desulfamplus sp.]